MKLHITILSLSIFFLIVSIHLGAIWLLYDQISLTISELRNNSDLNQKLLFVSFIPIVISSVILFIAIIRKMKILTIASVLGGVLAFLFIRFKILYSILFSLGFIEGNGRFLLIFLSLLFLLFSIFSMLVVSRRVDVEKK